MGMVDWRRGRGPVGGRARRRRYKPEVAGLESRALMSVNVDWTSVNVAPQIIPNTPDGRQVPVAVAGIIATNHPETPKGLFFVTDEYRADEPRGPVALTPLGKSKQGLYQYGFVFQISLQAKRSTNTPDGRHYNLFVGATDRDGTAGRTVTVLVPKNFAATVSAKPPKVTPTPPAPRPHPFLAARQRRGVR
jgi:hypothetical protein